MSALKEENEARPSGSTTAKARTSHASDASHQLLKSGGGARPGALAQSHEAAHAAAERAAARAFATPLIGATVSHHQQYSTHGGGVAHMFTTAQFDYAPGRDVSTPGGLHGRRGETTYNRLGSASTPRQLMFGETPPPGRVYGGQHAPFGGGGGGLPLPSSSPAAPSWRGAQRSARLPHP